MCEGSVRGLRRIPSTRQVDGTGSGDAGASVLRLRVPDPLLGRLHHRLNLPPVREVVQVQGGGGLCQMVRG